MKRMYLVDVSSLFFRAFYAVRPLSAPSGLPTNAIYGFLSMVTKLLKDEKPDYLIFCYDRKEPSFRKEIFPEYKAHRAETPEDLVPQIPYIKKLAEVLGVPSWEVPGYEADDLIGTLVKVGRQHDLDVYVVSGDKDFGQLIDDHVYLYDTMKGIKLDAAGVKEKWGVSPDKFIDYLALVGDTSDNIPGVDGIGPKGAQKLIEQYGSLDAVYAHMDEIKGAIKDKLLKNKDNAYLSRELVKIVTNVPVDSKLENFELRPIKMQELHELMQELDFKNLERTLEALPQRSKESSLPSPLPADPPPAEKEGSLSENPLLGWQEIAVSADEVSAHLKKNDSVWGLSDGHRIYLAVERRHQILVLQGEAADFGPRLEPLSLQWKGFDLKSFWHVLKLEHPQAQWDTLLAAYVVKAGESMEWDRVYSRFTGELPQDLPSPSQLLAGHLKLQESLSTKLHDIHALKIVEELEFPLITILYKMERKGIRLDTALLAEQSRELGRELLEIEKGIFELAGETFNVGSPKQLGHILFEKLKLPTGKKTKTGFSTDNEVLEKLRQQHPIADMILMYRELSKLKSTYVDALPQLVREDGRLHTTFNQALTTTGRLSSTEPNLQNIPIRTERGARVRKAFVAEPGHALLSVDYGQIELRVLAHYSDDPGLQKAFLENLDVHAATASEVFAVPLSKVTSDMRRTAKAINFGIAYGQGAFGLAENLGIPRAEAQGIIKRYFERFHGVQTYIEETIRRAQQDGYVETLYGRRRYIDELKSGNGMIRKFGERAAINAPIQGTAADIVKKAMIELGAHVPVPMILQVHDELIFEGKPQDLHRWTSTIVKIMESVAPQLKVPLKANSAIGENWDQAH